MPNLLSDAGMAESKSCLFAKLQAIGGSYTSTSNVWLSAAGWSSKCDRETPTATASHAHNDRNAGELVLLRKQFSELQIRLLHALCVCRVDHKDNRVGVVLQRVGKRERARACMSESQRACPPGLLRGISSRNSFASRVCRFGTDSRGIVAQIHSASPSAPDFALTADVPHVQLEPLLHERLNVEALRWHDAAGGRNERVRVEFIAHSMNSRGKLTAWHLPRRASSGWSSSRRCLLGKWGGRKVRSHLSRLVDPVALPKPDLVPAPKFEPPSRSSSATSAASRGPLRRTSEQVVWG